MSLRGTGYHGLSVSADLMGWPSSRVWKVAAVVVGAASTALIFFASVPVESATSNISGWLRFFGVNRIPDWITAPWVDVVSIVGAVLLLVQSIGELRDRHRRRLRIISAPPPIEPRQESSVSP